jgi:hypothetical protein
MSAGQKLAALKQFVRLIVIHPSGFGCGGTGTVGHWRAKFHSARER